MKRSEIPIKQTSKKVADYPTSRQEWFAEGLEYIAQWFNDTKQEPRKIGTVQFVGCGISGGNKYKYQQMLLRFQKEHNIKVVTYFQTLDNINLPSRASNIQ